MNTGYFGEKIMHRQRVCPKCTSFVTHEKVSDNQFACPLCGNRIDGPPVRVRRISPNELSGMIAAQVRRKNEQSKA
jgi:ribosomal protein L37AE/L43A